MKILTVCQRGNNRSAALAYILRDERGPNEVLNYGPQGGLSLESIDMLCNWADKIIVVVSEFDVPEKWQYKRIHMDIGGPDRWGIGFHPELLQLLREKLNNVIL